MGFLQVRQKKDSWGKEICFQCDFCGTPFVRSYKKRLLSTKTGHFCSYACSGSWKFENKSQSECLHGSSYRDKAQRKIRNTYKDKKQSIVKKIKETTKAKYGVDNVSKLPHIKKQKQRTTLSNFGVGHHWSSPLIRKKIHNTMKENGSYSGISKIQSEFGMLLNNEFGKENVAHSIIKNGWEIDFYIKSLKAYVQFDGVYWHGLDRSLNEIEKSDKQRDIAILKTVERDASQARWFAQNGLKLIRITDKEYINYGEKVIKHILLERV